MSRIPDQPPLEPNPPGRRRGALQQVIHLVGRPTRQARDRLPVALELVFGLAILILVGAGLLVLPAMTTRPLTFMEALFTSTSAAAVTGLSLFPISTDLTFRGQLVLLFLVEIGGISLIAAVAFFFRLIGRRITLADRLAITSSMHLDSSRRVLEVMARAMLFMLVIEGLGAAALYLHWRLSGIVPSGQVAYYAIFHAVTAYCNAGFDLFSGLPQYPNGLPTDPLTLVIIGALIVLGGLGIPIYMDLLYRPTKRRLTLHTKVTFQVSAALIVAGFIGLLICEYQGGGAFSGMSLFQRALLALFQSVAARTAGFASIPGFNQILPSSSLLLMVLMFIGTAPASTGGGITTGTFVILWAAVVSYARGAERTRLGKWSLPNSLVLHAMIVFAVSLTLVILATWLLLITNGFNLVQSLFEIISAYSTTGLSLGITPSLNTAGRIILILTMFVGRLGAITIMIALLGRKQRPNLREYPEQEILVG